MRRQRIKEAAAREDDYFGTAVAGAEADSLAGRAALTAAGVYGTGISKEVSDRLSREISREANKQFNRQANKRATSN